MKKLILLIITIFSIAICYPQQQQTDDSEVLSNESIISMFEAKMPKKIILSKIETTKNDFDMSSDAIISLTEKKLGEEIILTMFNALKDKRNTLEVMTNEVVTEMFVKKVSKKVILAKIKESSGNYDLTTEGLIKLTTDKIPSDIQMAIMDAKKRQDTKITKNSIVKTTKKFNKPTSFANVSSPGIYYFDGNNNTFSKLDPNVFSQSKVSGNVLNKAVSGWFKVKEKAVINGANANMQLIDSDINFYFYFDNKGSDGEEITNDIFDKVVSPNEFVLVKFKIPTANDAREVEMGSTNIEGGTSGINNQQVVKFKYEKINDNLFRVYFDDALDTGEYCFMTNYNSSTKGQVSKLYDFGVHLD
jgi:hypothetical protein